MSIVSGEKFYCDKEVVCFPAHTPVHFAENKMKMMDCVEVVVEKPSYTEEGVHKGMQGWICMEECVNGRWMVNFPQYGENPDIATLGIREEDMVLLPNGMNAKVNEQIKERFEGVASGEN